MVLWLVGGSQPGFAALRTRRPLEHAARAFCAAVELTAFYFAISKIPLPTAMSIVSASPIFGTLLGVVFLRERLRLGGWIAVFAGFAGVLLVVQPEEGANSLIGTIAVLTSVVPVVLRPAVRAAAQHHREQPQHPVLLRDRRRHHPRHRDAVRVGQSDAAGMGGSCSRSGVFGCLGQYFLILSLRYAPMSLLAPFEYSALVWASLYGFIFWGDVLGPIAIAGVAIIVAACLYITRTMEH